MYDIIVVGAGPAGLTAALYAVRAGKSVLLLEKANYGGQMAFSPKIEYLRTGNNGRRAVLRGVGLQNYRHRRYKGSQNRGGLIQRQGGYISDGNTAQNSRGEERKRVFGQWHILLCGLRRSFF